MQIYLLQTGIWPRSYGWPKSYGGPPVVNALDLMESCGPANMRKLHQSQQTIGGVQHSPNHQRATDIQQSPTLQRACSSESDGLQSLNHHDHRGIYNVAFWASGIS